MRTGWEGKKEERNNLYQQKSGEFSVTSFIQVLISSVIVGKEREFSGEREKAAFSRTVKREMEEFWRKKVGGKM